jgi:hypothetical protein
MNLFASDREREAKLFRQMAGASSITKLRRAQRRYSESPAVKRLALLKAKAAARHNRSQRFGEAVIDNDLHLNVGIAGQEFRQRGLEDADRRMLASSDPDHSSRPLAQRAQRCDLVFDFLESWGDRVNSRPPASVGETLRVLRVSSRRPSRANYSRLAA